MFICLNLLFLISVTKTLAFPTKIIPRFTDLRLTAQLEAVSHFAAAAYCKGNTHSAGQYLSCLPGNCPFVEQSNVWVTEAFWNIGESNSIGFVAVDDTNHVIVLAFQGTANALNKLTDAAFLPISTELCGTGDDECKIHRGFWHAWLDVESIVTDSVLRAVIAHPSYGVIATGHSLGGALAALAATSLRNGGMSVDLYTYGQPRLGFEGISNYITNQAPAKGKNYRVTHTNDVVPQLPQHKAGGWDHFSPEYHIENSNIPVYGEAITEYIGLFNESGNAGTDWPDSVEDVKNAHTKYFGNITDCFSGERDSTADLTAVLDFIGVPKSLLE
ncbi:Alpha/Beta hydrolase protein [Cadophora sp. MPI-SDFR-AT-0126]|nr:Alpha/Beta hydrolase protein [Leotiomycetes sp. MPI-SDFR-AT-0126]